MLLFVNAAEFYFPSGLGPGGFMVMPNDKGQVVKFWELSVTCSEMGCGCSWEKIEKQKAVAAGVGREAEFLSFSAPSPVQAQQHLDVPLVMAALGIRLGLFWKAVASFIKQYLESACWMHCTTSIALWDTLGNWTALPGEFGFCLRTLL